MSQQFLLLIALYLQLYKHINTQTLTYIININIYTKIELALFINSNVSNLNILGLMLARPKHGGSSTS